MKKLMLSWGIVCLGFLWPLQLQASEDHIVDGMVDKAVNGAINLFTGIVEFPVQIYKGYKNGVTFIENDKGSKAVGTVLGFFKGIGHAAGRTAWGGLELVGFWSANRESNEGIGLPLDAKYAWEEGEPYSIFEPNLKEGVKPVGRKLVYGLSDTFTAIAELPGQAVKGKQDGKLGTGLLKGVWFWWSRQLYGFGSILTAIVPNPKDNPGFAYDGEFPWSALTESLDKE